MKPSPSRAKLLTKFVAANGMIRQFLEKKKHTDYINVYQPISQADGPMPDIFIQDNLKMNEKGYAIRQKVIGPYLVKD